MSEIRVDREVTTEEARSALARELPAAYQVSVKAGSSSALLVRRSGMVSATVHLSSADGGTSFRVSGGGLILLRAINHFLIAREVQEALHDSFAAA